MAVQRCLSCEIRLILFATDCNLGTFLPRALSDQFVSGIRDGNTKKKLLSQDTATLEDVIKIATADEAAKYIQWQHIPKATDMYHDVSIPHLNDNKQNQHYHLDCKKDPTFMRKRRGN